MKNPFYLKINGLHHLLVKLGLEVISAKFLPLLNCNEIALSKGQQTSYPNHSQYASQLELSTEDSSQEFFAN